MLQLTFSAKHTLKITDPENLSQ